MSAQEKKEWIASLISRAWDEECKRREGIEGLSFAGFKSQVANVDDGEFRLHTELLEPWFTVFEVGLWWLNLVHFVLSLSSEEELPIPSDEKLLAPWALMGIARSYGEGVRTLMLRGLDSPARACLRSFTESLLLCLAIFEDEELGVRYRAAQGPEAAKSFWHVHVSPKKLHERIVALERRAGLGDAHISELTEWRKDRYEMFSEAVHPSYVNCIAMMFVSEGEGEDAPHRYQGRFDSVIANSVETASFAARLLWQFQIFARIYLFAGLKGKGPYFTLSDDDPMHKAIFAAGEVLNAATLASMKRHDDEQDARRRE